MFRHKFSSVIASSFALKASRTTGTASPAISNCAQPLSTLGNLRRKICQRYNFINWLHLWFVVPPIFQLYLSTSCFFKYGFARAKILSNPHFDVPGCSSSLSFSFWLSKAWRLLRRFSSKSLTSLREKNSHSYHQDLQPRRAIKLKRRRNEIQDSV